MRLTNSLVNIRAITSHFNPKIEAWLAAQQLSTPSEEQILEVVKGNYDSLTLKLQVKRTRDSLIACCFRFTLNTEELNKCIMHYATLWKINA